MIIINNLTFLKLKKNCKKDMSALENVKISLLGNCATQHLSTAICGMAYEKSYAFDIFDADYNQIDSEILDNSSNLYAHNAKFILLYICTEKLYEEFCDTNINDRANFADNIYNKLLNYWQIINANTKSNIIQFSFAEKDDTVFGCYSPKLELSFLYQIKKLNLKIYEGSMQNKNVFIFDLNNVYFKYGYNNIFDEKIYFTAKMPISLEYLPIVSQKIVSNIEAILGRFKKCVILDLDNTLWGGVIGDDGLDKIEIGELNRGMAFTALQRYILELKNRGIILAVCSKNEEQTAKEPFLKHPEMLLKLEDISIFVANWEDKATNIKYIQNTLNIGMDSIVFLDDNPFERNAVKSLIPEITVPDLPEDPAMYLSFLEDQNLFDTSSYAKDDMQRTEQYRAEMGRKQTENQFSSYDDYLKSLDMIAKVSEFDKFHYPRIAQLSQRSNQFNLRTVRHTEADIEKLANDKNYITLYFTLEDKFGDHGLISVVILEKREKSLFIHQWLMSCRVLKRGMEEFIVDSIIKTAKNSGFDTVIGEYIPTQKNMMVKDIYSQLGFNKTENEFYTVDVNSYKMHKTYIKEK